MTVLVFEHCFRVGGHRLSYASLVAKAISSHPVTVAVPAVLRGLPEVEQYFSDSRIEFYEAEQPESPYRSASLALRCLNQMIAETSPTHVLIPTADGMATLAGASPLAPSIRHRSVPIHIGLMIGRRPNQELSAAKRVINGAKWRLLRRGPWASVTLMDPRAWSELPDEQSVLLGPDPVPELGTLPRERARQLLGLDPDARWLVSAGNQDSRKGVPELIRGFCHFVRNPSDRLLIIGRCNVEVLRALRESEGKPAYRQIEVRDQFVSEQEFVQAIAAADVVAALYRNTMRPSGVVSRCIAWGIPILGRDSGWLRWAVSAFDAGWTTNPNDVNAFGDSLLHALNASSDFVLSPAAQSFAAFNTASNYQALWDALVEDRQVPRPSPELVSAFG